MPGPYDRKKMVRALELIYQGLIPQAVADHPDIKVHRTTVLRWAKRAGITFDRHNRHRTRDDLTDRGRIIELRKLKDQNGRAIFTYERIARLCRCSRSWVSQVLKEARRNGDL